MLKSNLRFLITNSKMNLQSFSTYDNDTFSRICRITRVKGLAQRQGVAAQIMIHV